jgi:hypothetical protein
MPYTPDTAYTLGTVLDSYDPEGKLHDLIDVFKDKRPIIEEGYWIKANDKTTHEYLRVASRPTGAFIRINEGYTNEGVGQVPVKCDLAMIGSRCDLDKRLAKRQPSPSAWRAQRNKIHVRGMVSNFNTKWYTGSHTTDEKEVDGLLTTYNALTCTNIKNLSGSTNLYPVVIVKWGEDGVFGLYPDGEEPAFTEDDQGIVQLFDSNNLPFPGYRSYFNFAYGWGLGDEKNFRRLVNVDYTAIASASSYTFENALIEQINELSDPSNAVIYCGRQILTAIQQRINMKSNVNFTAEQVWGRMLPTFNGIPIVRDDALSTSESAVT